MKKILYLLAIIPLFTSCEDFLDVNSYTTKNSSTFPVNENDAAQLVVGVYANLNTSIASPQSTYFFAAEVVSDDRFGGGGENDKEFLSMGHLLYNNTNQFQVMWQQHYQGIARANAAVTALDVMEDGDLKNQKQGEARFLRAFYYFELAQMFGEIPLMKSSPESVQEAIVSPPQSSADEVFQQIGTDLWLAYSTMPSVKWDEVSSGTATKWAAASLLARVWLFYTGFYSKDALPIDDGQVTKDQVAAALKDVIDNSGHSLLGDFRSLWPYTNKLTKGDYAFAKDAPDWVEDGKNPEHVFVIKCSHLASWGTSTGYANQFCLFFGIRNGGQGDLYQTTFPFGQGWGSGPVNTSLWDEWKADEPNDIRRSASIWNQEDEVNGSYYWGNDAQMEETGLWQKKIVATTSKKSDGSLYNSFTAPYYNHPDNDDFQIGYETDFIQIRYADVLLMYSEITKTVDGINAVRTRAGLPSIATYTDDALRKERRYELAFEGLRWGDIRRWKIAETALAKKYGVAIKNRGVSTFMKPQGAADLPSRYKATNGFWMIPQTEVDLANGALTQNLGWGTEAIFNSWVD